MSHTSDIIVVGTGPAGLCAIASALHHNSTVTVIESASRTGGNGVYSTGWVAFVDSALQRSQGLHDTEAIFLSDCRKLVEEHRHLYGIIFDEELAKVFAKESAKMYDFLTARGVRFTHLIKRPLQASVDRLHAVEDTEMFPRAFDAEFRDERVKTYLKATADRLIIDNGVVKGVRVQPQDGSGPFEVRANKGVVLAAGGFQANPELRRRFQLDIAAEDPYPGLETCRGDAHLMGQAVGADLINMTVIPPLIIVASAMIQEAIAVNVQGRRFHDEAGPYYHRVLALRQQPEQKAYYVMDSTTYDTKKKYVNQIPGGLVEADSLAQLAAKINVPANELEQSVKQWNEFLASGEARDPVTGRVAFSEERKPIEKAPFYSGKMVTGVSLSCGGFVTTTSMQVVDVFGRPIPGLFAAGDCSGGFTPSADMGGTHLGGGFVLGWVAGRAAAESSSTTPHTKAVFGNHLPSHLQSTQDSRMPIIHTGSGL